MVFPDTNKRVYRNTRWSSEHTAGRLSCVVPAGLSSRCCSIICSMKFSRTYEVRFSEADRRGCVTPVALYNYLQETAVYHGESPHETRITLSEKGLAWVLTRIFIQFIRYPKQYDEVLVTTWASNLSGLYAVREWTVEDPNGESHTRSARVVVPAGRIVR